jgi:hypothetical protein
MAGGAGFMIVDTFPLPRPGSAMIMGGFPLNPTVSTHDHEEWGPGQAGDGATVTGAVRIHVSRRYLPVGAQATGCKAPAPPSG